MNEGAGILLFAKPTGRMLFLLREDGTWGIPGGHRDFDDESTLDTMLRELTEETGYDGPVGMRHQRPETVVCILRSGTFITGVNPRECAFSYYVYRGWTPNEFAPELDGEHADFVWELPEYAPHPLHRGVDTSLRDLRLRGP